MTSLYYYLERIRELPPKVVVKKALIKPVAIAARKLEKLDAKLRPVYISDEQLLENVNGFTSLQEVLRYIRGKRPKFFIEPSEKEPLVALIQSDFPGLKEEILAEADKVCSHVFNLLGSGDVDLDQFAEEQGGRRVCGYLPWHFDFKTGYQWNPRKFYKEIKIPYGKADIKVPWELSRFQHVSALGQAYWLTGSESYADEFVKQVDDWIDRNPPKFGVNWACTMDVAIRVANWILGFCFFKDSPVLTDAFLLKFLKSLLIHGRHIVANLERSWRGVNSNHYLSDIVGLVYLGAMFSEFKEAQKWHEFGIKELIREMERQVYPDGVDYEGSISYHRLVTELFLLPTLLCLKNGISFPDWYMKQLEKMIEFVMYYTKPDGAAPQVGDNDDGRLHILANYGKWNRIDHRYLLSIGAVLFDRPDFKGASGGFHEEAFWLLGEEGLKKFYELPKQGCPVSPKAFPDGGFYVMRSNDLYMIVDCIPTDPKSPSGHKHNSRLSFELFAYDKSFLIDPGAYIYTADKEMRNLFRSTKYHNTVVVDDQEQNRFAPNEPFSMRHDVAIKVNKWESTDEHDFLNVEHYGYKRLKDPVVHRRQIYFNKLEGYWAVKDILDGEGVHQFDLYFHFAPIAVELDSKFPLVVKTKTGGANLAIIPLLVEGVSVGISDGWVSYRYGVKEKASIVRYSRTAQAPAGFCNIFYPYLESVTIDNVMEKIQHRLEFMGF